VFIFPALPLVLGANRVDAFAAGGAATAIDSVTWTRE